MTRDELIDQVIRPYKEGDIIQYRDTNMPYGWDDKKCGPEDPLDMKFSLSHCEYRIKPRTITWTMDLPAEIGPSFFADLAQQVWRCDPSGLSKLYPSDTLDAIRNAKPLPEGSAE